VSDDIALPDLQDALLDPGTLAQLFFDLSQLAEVLEIRVKGAPTALATEELTTLEAARTALASGAAMAVQLRYRFEGRLWLDTLMRTPSGVRIVRMASPV
jgi:hypothetical protein